jgi:hypothetical protein
MSVYGKDAKNPDYLLYNYVVNGGKKKMPEGKRYDRAIISEMKRKRGLGKYQRGIVGRKGKPQDKVSFSSLVKSGIESWKTGVKVIKRKMKKKK